MQPTYSRESVALFGKFSQKTTSTQPEESGTNLPGMKAGRNLPPTDHFTVAKGFCLAVKSGSA